MSYWAVCQTEPRREHAARVWLMRKCFETYMPRLLLQDGRVKLLFPTYIFWRFHDRWYQVRWTPGVCRVLMDAGQPARLGDEIMDQIRKREVAGFVKLPSVEVFKRGDKLRIRNGSFRDQVGLYEGQSGRERVRLLLELMGQKVPVDLASRDVEPLDVAD